MKALPYQPFFAEDHHLTGTTARETGLERESLYKALSLEGNPEFATVLKVLQVFGLHLHGSGLNHIKLL